MERKWRRNTVLAVLLLVTRREKDTKLKNNFVSDIAMKT